MILDIDYDERWTTGGEGCSSSYEQDTENLLAWIHGIIYMKHCWPW